MNREFKVQLPLTRWHQHHATPGLAFKSIVQISATQSRPVTNCTIKLPPSLPTNTCGWNFYTLIFCFGLAVNSAAGSGEMYEHCKANRRNTLLWYGEGGVGGKKSFSPGGSDCSDPSRRSPATPVPCPLSCDHLKDPLWKPVGQFVVYSETSNLLLSKESSLQTFILGCYYSTFTQTSHGE